LESVGLLVVVCFVEALEALLVHRKNEFWFYVAVGFALAFGV